MMIKLNKYRIRDILKDNWFELFKKSIMEKLKKKKRKGKRKLRDCSMTTKQCVNLDWIFVFCLLVLFVCLFVLNGNKRHSRNNWILLKMTWLLVNVIKLKLLFIF